MKINKQLIEINLNPDNCIIIGSGILNALNIRESKDIDLVVTEVKYKELFNNPRFKKEESSEGAILLKDDLFEIGTHWKMEGGTNYSFDDLFKESIVINDVRYISLQFLLKIKQQWVADGIGRPKDINDIKLIEDYLVNN